MATLIAVALFAWAHTARRESRRLSTELDRRESSLGELRSAQESRERVLERERAHASDLDAKLGIASRERDAAQSEVTRISERAEKATRELARAQKAHEEGKVRLRVAERERRALQKRLDTAEREVSRLVRGVPLPSATNGSFLELADMRGSSLVSMLREGGYKSSIIDAVEGDVLVDLGTFNMHIVLHKEATLHFNVAYGLEPGGLTGLLPELNALNATLPISCFATGDGVIFQGCLPTQDLTGRALLAFVKRMKAAGTFCAIATSDHLR